MAKNDALLLCSCAGSTTTKIPSISFKQQALLDHRPLLLESGGLWAKNASIIQSRVEPDNFLQRVP